MINVDEIKKKILAFLEQKGPSLPIHVSREVELSLTFTSAILAELANEKRVILSKLKVGSSPLYLLPDQTNQLEQHTDNLEGIEKEAYNKLKQTQILQDETQTPAIRVALRSISDFAKPIRYHEKVFWRYFTLSNEQAQQMLSKKHIPQQRPRVIEQVLESTPRVGRANDNERGLGGHTKNSFKEIKPKKRAKPGQNFLEETKEFLQKNNIELISLKEFNKRKIIATVRINSQEYLATVFNKKRITDAEVIKAYKQAAELGLSYYIITKGAPTKKMQDSIQAYKNLLRIDIIE